MTGIFNSIIFANNIFNVGTAGPIPPAVVADAKPGGGGIEGVYKPTGLTKRKKLKLKKVDERIEEFQDAQIEITRKLRQEFIEESPATIRQINIMSMAEIETEIGTLMREKIRTEEEELMLILLIAQASS